MAKTYLAFVYADYYPSGGGLDCIGQFEDKESAMKAVESKVDESTSGNIMWVDGIICEVIAVWNSNDHMGAKTGWLDAEGVLSYRWGAGRD